LDFGFGIGTQRSWKIEDGPFWMLDVGFWNTS
jgi:hypothetical protein